MTQDKLPISLSALDEVRKEETNPTAVAVHNIKTLEKAKEIVESYCSYPKPVLYKDGRWTLQVGASGMTQLGWSATERELWIDLAIWMAKPKVAPVEETARETRWIDCKKELPAFGERVLAYSPANKHQSRRYFVTALHVYSDKKEMIWLDEDINEWATHWMPLPAPPVSK